MKKAIIIDDESNARESIVSLCKLTHSEIDIVGEAAGVESGLEVIRSLKPDLVFLDIQLEDGTGFDILEKTDQIDFHIIFITAFNEYAIKAFKFAAIDYLLKPINPKEFKTAIDHFCNIRDKEDIETKLLAYLSHIKESVAEHKKIILKTAESIHLIKVFDIIRCEADKGYTEFFMRDNKKILVSKGLKEYDEMLGEFGFIRTHQSHLINLDYIASFEKTDGGYILMTDGSTVPVSSRKREYVFNVFENL
jgi:two-component system LytT family response regulator